jgi:hypothetical protein
MAAVICAASVSMWFALVMAKSLQAEHHLTSVLPRRLASGEERGSLSPI